MLVKQHLALPLLRKKYDISAAAVSEEIDGRANMDFTIEKKPFHTRKLKEQTIDMYEVKINIINKTDCGTINTNPKNKNQFNSLDRLWPQLAIKSKIAYHMVHNGMQSILNV